MPSRCGGGGWQVGPICQATPSNTLHPPLFPSRVASKMAGGSRILPDTANPAGRTTCPACPMAAPTHPTAVTAASPASTFTGSSLPPLVMCASRRLPCCCISRSRHGGREPGSRAMEVATASPGVPALEAACPDRAHTPWRPRARRPRNGGCKHPRPCHGGCDCEPRRSCPGGHMPRPSPHAMEVVCPDGCALETATRAPPAVALPASYATGNAASVARALAAAP